MHLDNLQNISISGDVKRDAAILISSMRTASSQGVNFTFGPKDAERLANVIEAFLELVSGEE